MSAVKVRLLACLAAALTCAPALSAQEKARLVLRKLEAAVREIDADLEGVMGVAIRALTSGETILRDPDEVFPQASSIKIAVLVSTPREMMTLLQAIHSRRLFGPERTADLLKVLSTHKESAMLRGLPDDASAANKSGALEAVRTDSGIVFAPNRPFVLCVMTTYLKSERAGEEAISRIAAAAWTTSERLGRASEYGRVFSPR